MRRHGQDVIEGCAGGFQDRLDALQGIIGLLTNAFANLRSLGKSTAVVVRAIIFHHDLSSSIAGHICETSSGMLRQEKYQPQRQSAEYPDASQSGIQWNIQ